MLMSLFERAYLLMHEVEDVREATAPLAVVGGLHARNRRQRADFRALLPQLLDGEDPEFVSYLRALAANSTRRPSAVRGVLASTAGAQFAR